MNIQNSITVVSMSRRTELYQKFILDIESKIGHLIKEYIVFVNDPNIFPFYKNLQNTNNKINVISASEDFIYKYGHDKVYNYLESKVTSQYILKLFDTDLVEINVPEFEKELALEKDLYGILTYMVRGDSWEQKYQLYKSGLFQWEGCVHENLELLDKTTQISQYDLKSFQVFHKNALDKESKELKKTPDGFIILEKTEEGSDSDRRNMLYEYLGFLISSGQVDHKYKGWFEKHYFYNKSIIDLYVARVKERYKL